MPEQIGNINIPDLTPSGVFPLVSDYGLSVTRNPVIVQHLFENKAANRKIEQRFYIGPGAKRFKFIRASMTEAQRSTLYTFWVNRKGPYQPFTYNAPNADGTTTAYTVCFALDEPFEWSYVSQVCTSTGLTFVEVPTSSPSYAIASTDTRFPGNALATALLSQVQEIIPLVKIQPKKTGGYPAIYLSDRRVTVGGQLYQPRLLENPEVSQAMNGESDVATFQFGNADRVMRDLANDVDLFRARIEYSLFHIGTGIKLDLWAGEVTDYASNASAVFTVNASDGIAELSLPYPNRIIDRRCYKVFNDGAACPAASAGGTNLGTPCDKGFDTPAGCHFHNMNRYFGGIIAQPQGVRIKDNASKFSRPTITATSIVNDTIYGQALPEIFTDDEMPVNALIAAGREESDFYRAMGILGRGPLTLANYDKHRLDGSPNHGAEKGTNLGYYGAPGADPANVGDKFGLNREQVNGKDLYAAGVAFIEITRKDAKGIQPTRAQEHSIEAYVTGGVQGWTWSSPGNRALNTLTNPVWIAVNIYLRAQGLENAAVGVQEATFDVQAAIDAAAVCSTSVPNFFNNLVNETQFKFRGVIRDQKPLRDWLQEVLGTCLGYYTMRFNQLRVGMRINSSVAEAFTEGNTLADSLEVAPLRPQFNRLTATFADQENSYAANTLQIYDIDHAARIGGTTQPKWMDAQLNLVGASNRSQVARIVTTRLREELGGVNETEQAKAVRLRFRTTILALAAEPGMVCSYTGPELSGGSGEFRIERIRIMRDYSVEIEGRTTTDAMYDYTVGPKPADVLPSGVPSENVKELIPNDVRPISGNAFSITVGTLEDSNGVKRTAIDLTYDPPSPAGVWDGVTCFVQTADGKVFEKGDLQYNGDLNGVGAARYGTARVLHDPPAATENWTVYLTSRSRIYRNALYLTTAPSPSPYRTVSVNPVDPIGPPTTPGPAGTEWAALVTGFSASVAYKTAEDGSQMYGFTGSWSEPADTKYAGVAIIARPLGGGNDIPIGTLAKGTTSFSTSFWPINHASESFRLYAVSFNRFNQQNTIHASTPFVDVTVQRQVGPTGTDVAPNVTGYTASIDYSVDEAGDEIFRLKGSWTNPVDPKFKGVAIVWAEGAPLEYKVLAVEQEGSTRFETAWFAVPVTPVAVGIYAVSIDSANRRNTIVPSTPVIIFTIQRQGNTIPNVTGFTASVVLKTDETGGQTYGFRSSWSLPADRTKFRGVHIVYRNLGTGYEQVLAHEYDGSTGVESGFWPIPDAAENVRLYAVSIDGSNRQNTLAGSPSVDLTVQKDATGTLKLNRAASGSFNVTEFEISGAVFQQKAINADKITIGTTLKVGGGASAKPGQIGVFNASDVLIGWIGTNGGFFGAWFKQLYIGGTSPADAKVIADASGNVTINGATFSLTANSTTTTINHADVANFGRIGVKVSSGGRVSALCPSQIYITNSSGTIIGMMIDSAGSGALNLYSSAGVLIFDLSPDASQALTVGTGAAPRYISASAGYRVNGVDVVTSRRTGWGSPTGTNTRSGFDTTTVTTQQLAEHIKALIEDLKAHGLIGT